MEINSYFCCYSIVFMMSEIKYGYNLFGNYWAACLLTVPVIIAFLNGGVNAAIFALCYYAVGLGVAWYLSVFRSYLVIDEAGVFLDGFMDSSFVAWENVGTFISHVSVGKRDYIKTGAGITYLHDGVEGYGLEFDDGDDYALFIPIDKVAAKGSEIEDVVNQGKDFYVNGNQNAFDIVVSETPFKTIFLKAALSISILAWIAFNFYQEIGLENLGGHEVDVYHTLIHGHMGPYSETSPIVFAGILLVFGLFILPSLLFKGYHTILSSALVICMGLSYAFYYEQNSLRRQLVENCSQPLSSPIEEIETTVLHNEKGHGSINRGHLAFDVIYDGKNYEVRTDYLPGAEVGMTVRVKIQRGAKGYPIIRDYSIADIFWSMKGGRTKSLEELKAEKAARTADSLLEVLGIPRSERYVSPRDKALRAIGSNNEKYTRSGRRLYGWPTMPEKEVARELIVNGHNLGMWMCLRSELGERFDDDFYGLMAAIQQEPPHRVLLLVGQYVRKYDRENDILYPGEGAYITNNFEFKNPVEVRFMQREHRYQLIPHDSIPNVWYLGKKYERAFWNSIISAQYTVAVFKRVDGYKFVFVFEPPADFARQARLQLKGE